MTTAPLLHAVTLLVAASALVVALRTPAADHPAVTNTSPPALDAEVQRLRERVDALLARPVAVDATGADEPARAVADADLLRRVESLERRSIATAGGAHAQGPGTAAPAALSLDELEGMMNQLRDRQRERERVANVARAAEAAAVFVDATKSEADRLRALGQLRFAGRGARGGAVAQAAIGLVQTSQDPATRADVWRQLSGADDPVLVPHLIRSLQADADERVREEAAETLGDYRDDPTARAALQAAAQDASERVRRQVARSLGGGR